MRQTELVRAEVIARDKRICQYCGKGKLYKRQLHLDHIVPESDGGQCTVENMVVSCSQCNTRKGKKSQQQYAQDRLKQLQREQHYLTLLLAKTPF